MIPFGDLSRTYHRLRPEIDRAAAEVLGSGWFILGEKLADFERRWARYCGVDHAIGVGNGTDAIALALEALGVGPGDEVVTTPLSAAFTALAVSRIGAVPVFADIDPERRTMSPDSVASVLTARTRALLPVHLYGQPADMDALNAIAREHGLVVVEDAAQAHGAAYAGTRVGGLADAAAFSFYPSKNLGAFGDGGAVTTGRADVAEKLRMLRDGGQSSRYQHDLVGANSRLDELQAAFLTVRLEHLDSDNERRRAIAATYDSALSGSGIADAPRVADGVDHVFHLYVVRSDDRDALASRLADEGIATAVHYPTPIHMQPAYGGADRRGECPESERACGQVLSIPSYPELTDAEVERIAAVLRSATA